MSGWVGYITDFDGATVTDGTNTKHTSLVIDTDVVMARFFTLPNGTKVNYDGTSDAATFPGTCQQRIKGSGNNVGSQFSTLMDKKGNRGTLTLTKVDGVSQLTCNAVLIDVRIISTSLPPKKFYEYVCLWELEDDWEVVP